MTNLTSKLEFDEEGAFVRIRLRGTATVSAVKSVYRAVLRSYPNENRLWDYREADLSKLTTQDLAAIRDFAAAREAGAEARRVVLLVSRDLDFGIARMYGSMAEAKYPARFSVFREKDAAENWLRIKQQ